MREDSAEEISSPNTVLALVKAPLASMALEPGGELLMAPVEIFTLEELAEEVPSLFFEALEAVVMVVFAVVGGNRSLLLSVVLVLEEEDMITASLHPHTAAERLGRASGKTGSTFFPSFTPTLHFAPCAGNRAVDCCVGVGAREIRPLFFFAALALQRWDVASWRLTMKSLLVAVAFILTLFSGSLSQCPASLSTEPGEENSVNGSCNCRNLGSGYFVGCIRKSIIEVVEEIRVQPHSFIRNIVTL